MAFKILILSSLLNIPFVVSMSFAPRIGHGLIGYGITMYKPPCAFSCRSSIASSHLNCATNVEEADQNLDIYGEANTPNCYTTNDVFLQTLAWCISTHCTDVPTWQLEKYWEMNVAGTAAFQPSPKESYQEALSKIAGPPKETLINGGVLNNISLISEDDYVANFNGMVAFESQEDTHERFGLVLLLSGAAIPIGFSLLRFIPWPARLTSEFNAYFIYPPALGSRHNEAICSFAHVPTRGQAFFMFYLISINAILGSVGYHSLQPNSWFPNNSSGEILTYIANRLGILSFANIPLLVLYAGRNNILLWVTNWSHGTFLLLHRWVAFICTIEVVIHSIIYLNIHITTNQHSDQTNLQALVWGSIATISMVLLVPTSIFPLRKKLFELFHTWHVTLASLILAGCYWHIVHRFQHQWGYEVWIIVAMAVWGFDRAMRLAKLARNGLRTAVVTVIDEDYVRLDVEGVSGDGHAYLYFPTLTWLIWENHPFSVASTVISNTDKVDNRPRKHSAVDNSSVDIEKNHNNSQENIRSPSQIRNLNHSDNSTTTHMPKTTTKAGMTFLIRTRGGITSKIRSRASIPVLVESPYGPKPDLSEYSRVICIAGGVGITAVTPYFRSYQGRKKLFWGVHNCGIVDEMKNVLAAVEKEIFVGGRMDVKALLEQEFATITRTREKSVVVVSGPEGLADDVRMAVVDLGRRKGVLINFIEETFSW